MEKKGKPQACSECPNRIGNVQSNIRQAGDATLYFGYNVLSVGFVALGRHAESHVKMDIPATRVAKQYEGLVEAVKSCSGPDYVQTSEPRKLFGFIPVSADEIAICPAIRQEIGEPDAEAVMNYFESNNLSNNDKV